ncbi:MAG: kinase/pyrophosphorylase, partial [Proteobacteria bacterium]|nr:kinase/pyrophosphorylase [Pseudomonadota bacterium]
SRVPSSGPTPTRNANQMEFVIQSIEEKPGFVLYTLVDPELRAMLTAACRRVQAPCVSVLQPIMGAFGGYLKAEVHAQPGRQHVLDSEYYERIAAMEFTLAHDDGQSVWNLAEADIVILGVSRTSKTPTCMYLANRGMKVANVPIVLGVPIPEDLLTLKGPLIVGLTKEARSLVQIRRNRLRMLNEGDETDYVDPERVTEELNHAKRLYTQNGWPVIDISRRSIEETAAAILQLRANLVDGAEPEV